MLKCYDTLSGKYVTVEVSEQIETEVKRSYWREDMQERRYYKRCQPLDENINYTNDVADAFGSRLVREYELSVLRSVLSELDKQEQFIISSIYFANRTQKATARDIGLSDVQMNRLLKKLLKKIKDFYIQKCQQNEI